MFLQVNEIDSSFTLLCEVVGNQAKVGEGPAEDIVDEEDGSI